MQLDLDFPAWGVYAAIVLISLVAAKKHVEDDLAKIPWRWSYLSAYSLFLVHFLLPIAVFWALDRVGAIHDSSVIAAVIVAFTYGAIVLGTSETKNAAVSALFSPVLKWIKDMPQKLGERNREDGDEFASEVANGVAWDPTRLPVLEQWVIVYASDLVGLRERLKDFEDTSKKPEDEASLEYQAWCKNRAERLLFFIEPTLPVRIAFHRMGLLPWRYLVTAIIRVDRAMGWGPPVAIILLVSFGLGKLLPTDWAPSRWATSFELPKDQRFEYLTVYYHRWRLLKPNETAADGRRSVRFFKEALDREIPPREGAVGRGTAGGSPGAASATGTGPSGSSANAVTRSRADGTFYSKTISELLQQPELSVQHAEDLVRAIFAGRLNRSDIGRSCEVLYLLPPALRSPNAEVRAFVNATLNESAGFLWDATPSDLPSQVTIGPDAKPVAIERSVDEWWDYLRGKCEGNVRAAGPPQGSESPPTSTRVCVKITVIPEVSFGFASARLRSDVLGKLWNAAGEIEDRRAIITGYTDSTGSLSYNMRLSRARALAVRDFFVHEARLDEAHFATFGLGPDEPIASNNTEEGRAKNRRVVVAVLSQEAEPGAVEKAP